MCGNSNARIVRHGFTMIELMVVMAILAVMAAIVVPMASSAGTMQLRAALNVLAADLEYAKSLSISTGQRHVVVFEKSGGVYTQYRIVVLDQAGNENPVHHPLTQKPNYIVSFQTDSRLSQVQIAGVNLNGLDKVGFNSLGSPLDANGSDLNVGEISLRAGSTTRKVNVAPVTGFITISN